MISQQKRIESNFESESSQKEVKESTTLTKERISYSLFEPFDETISKPKLGNQNC